MREPLASEKGTEPERKKQNRTLKSGEKDIQKTAPFSRKALLKNGAIRKILLHFPQKWKRAFHSLHTAFQPSVKKSMLWERKNVKTLPFSQINMLCINRVLASCQSQIRLMQHF